jgi:hypothetical protein
MPIFATMHGDAYPRGTVGDSQRIEKNDGPPAVRYLCADRHALVYVADQ